VAILGMSNGSSGGRTAKDILRLMLADPLKAKEDWETQLESHDPARPLIARVVGQEKPAQLPGFEFGKSSLLPEVDIASVTLGGNNIELLLMENNAFETSAPEDPVPALDEAILVPTVDIPASDTGRYTPIRTPVHKALIVTDGILGAATVTNMPMVHGRDEIAAAVNLRSNEEDASSCPFAVVDVASGMEAIAVFRQGVENAMKYESLWFKSNVPVLIDWLKQGTMTTPDGTTKPVVRRLVASVLQDTLAQIQSQEAGRLSQSLRSQTSAMSFGSLNKALADWAESAHAELQSELDAAFTGRRWRKLGWWKLFWRVDDVGMLSSEMVTRRFLPKAEQEAIYLAGGIEEAARDGDAKPPLYSAPAVSSVDGNTSSTEPSSPPLTTPPVGTRWPVHIPFTRGYLLAETIPALQALAQKLVLQTIGTSALATSLSTLMFLSSFGAYEAGAVGALGLVWSLGRMQKKWETARDFWEGEVREEGRKAVRAVEASVAEVLDKASSRTQPDEIMHNLRHARELVQKAEEALGRLK